MLENLTMAKIPQCYDDAITLPLISSTSLQTFIFGDETPMVSLQWIRRMVYITSLEIYPPRLPPFTMITFVHALNRANEEEFLPHLLNLTLSESKSEEISDALLDALKSRSTPMKEGVGALRSFHVIWPLLPFEIPPLSLIPVGQLRQLVADGMEIHVGTAYKNYF
jgi:hypothetical protein